MMKITQFIFLLWILPFYSQLKLEVKELKYETNKFLIPKHHSVLREEKEHKGYILELTLTNNSNEAYTIPLDTKSYALPFNEDLKVYYESQNLSLEPDFNNSLSCYAFIHQSNSLVDIGRVGNDWDIPALKKKEIIIKKRTKEINKWGKLNDISEDTAKIYNWYLVNNLIEIKPKTSKKYKIYFNPFVKNLYWYNDIDYYQLKPNLPYTLNFKIVCDENLYKFFTPKQKSNFKNLFTGVLESNTIELGNR
ncbi:MAG TPA: hypothetical protein PK067_00350 [Kaistella chaponensis]|uniref:hypothetical protein n=1 Tax=Kaistella chaponensis TaxID=713588 RepID=UPI002C4B5B74|nr:hypothetical protein [Kaistella chaponensis]HPW89191.1 hypothetical protein [Kaistella chaponensis]HQC05451.1 hypothetical protein [Kaistella chaponensis]